MAEGTRLKDVQEANRVLELKLMGEMDRREAIELNLQDQINSIALKIDEKNDKINNNMEALQIQLSKIAERMESYHRDKSIMGNAPESGNHSQPLIATPGNNSRHSHEFRQQKSGEDTYQTSNSSLGFNPSPKVDFPKFDGTNARAWLLKCHGYFQLVPNIPDENKVTFASLHLEGKAALWYGQMIQKKRELSWDQFVGLISARFEELREGKVLADFNKLKVTGTLDEYIDKFEELKSYMLLFNSREYDEEYFIASFVSGLPEESQSFFSLFEPKDLQQAIELARKQEATMEAISKRTKVATKQVLNSNMGFRKPTYTQPVTSAPRNINYTPPTLLPPRKFLTSAEMNARKEKGLCYNCDEKFFLGHRCKKQQVYVLLSEEDEEAYLQSMSEEENPVEEITDEDIQVSVNAIAGSVSNNIIRMLGQVGKTMINILIDTGSTHSFINEDLAYELNCDIESTNPMLISVADGGRIFSRKRISAFNWVMQGIELTYPVRLIKLGGCHMVLGCDWMTAVGLDFDFKSRSMGIQVDGKRVELKPASAVGTCKLISAQSLHKMLQMGDQGDVGCLFSIHGTAVSPISNSQVESLLEEYFDVFEEPKGLPPTRGVEHHIILKQNATPKQLFPYRYSHTYKNEIEQIVKELLSNGTIRHSQSPFASPVLLVRKKDSTWRMCVDYRYLNTLTIKHDYPIPIIDELLDELNGAKWFTKMDLRSGYFQIRMKEEDVYKTAFKTHHGHFEFMVMPFGLCNAPATFQSLMNQVFSPYLRKFILVFFDDILVYSRSFEEHLQHLDTTLSLLRRHQLFAKKSKCQFAQNKVEYLGHIISEDGVSTDPEKIKCMVDWPKPSTVKGLRGFLGLTGYYRKFIQGYGIISRPLTDMLKKDGFKWSQVAEEAFSMLKNAMVTSPVLALPDFTKQFFVETDASSTGIGAVLMQDGRPIAFISKALSAKNQVLSIYEREFMAVLLAIQKWKHYLQGNHFIIRTDQQSIKYIMEQKFTTALQQRWISKLVGLDYEVQYKKGSENKVADALSRREEVPGVVFALTTVQPKWMLEIVASYQGDNELQKIMAAKSVDTQSFADYSITQGVLRYKGRVCVGTGSDLRQKLIQSLHDSSIGGHSGMSSTYHRAKSIFFWKGLKTDVLKFVQSCDICKLAKHENNPYPGLLEPLEIPTEAWSHISMDFVEGLPKSEGKDVILVVVDRFTKFAHFLALSHPYTAVSVAKLFLDNVFKLHGQPVSIVTDRDRVFTSTFWSELFKSMGTRLDMSTAYHPQSDGQTERLNQCLETYLRCFTSQQPHRWSKWLSLAEYWYNTSYHSGLKMTPFLAMYGYNPPHLSMGPYLDLTTTEAKDLMQDRAKIIDIMKENLQHAQQRMKLYADKHRIERSFEVGDEVYLKLQPFRQHSVALRRNLKLSNRYFGPYKVIAKIGKVAYKLLLPPGSKVHDVFHVSLLKKKISSKHLPSPILPFTDVEGRFKSFPLRVLDKRLVKRHNAPVTQILVEWENLGPTQATWEDYSQIVAQFPQFDPWGQGSSPPGGNVMTRVDLMMGLQEKKMEEEGKNLTLSEIGKVTDGLVVNGLSTGLSEIGPIYAGPSTSEQIINGLMVEGPLAGSEEFYRPSFN